jgi:hypothetical protein
MNKTLLAPIILSVLLDCSCLPEPPKYPYLTNFDSLNVEAQKISDSLEGYVKLWYAGKASEVLPLRYVPKGYDFGRYKDFKLVRLENIDPKKQWAFRPAHEINKDKLFGSFPDPHVSYLLSPILLAPFGSKMFIEGDFPYCRFFNVQVTPPFDAHEYRYDKWSGKGEVSIVDADILPKPGHQNPFLPNADRTVKNRSYQVVYEMAMGNASAVDPTHRPPYRGNGKIRYGSAIQYQGPWAMNKKSGHTRGLWDFGDVWLRYYAIDKNKDVYAGVSIPKIYYELKSGEKFFIESNFDGMIKASETTMAQRVKGNANPAPYNGPDMGWDKQFGIFLQISSGVSKALYKEKPEDKEYIRKLDLGVNGRGEKMPAPACYEPHATTCAYAAILTSGTSIKAGKVFVITGKLPTYPATRNGEKFFKPAQCRYWSITSYDAEFPFSKIKGLEQTSLMDDEIIIDKDRKYIIVYSRSEDRPLNATEENGVTWVNWGYTCTQSFSIRWINVTPEWDMPQSPTETHLPWSKSTWSGTEFTQGYIGNDTLGFMGGYHPVKHYMTKEDFQSLGDKLDAYKIPKWEKK